MSHSFFGRLPKDLLKFAYWAPAYVDLSGMSLLEKVHYWVAHERAEVVYRQEAMRLCRAHEAQRLDPVSAGEHRVDG